MALITVKILRSRSQDSWVWGATCFSYMPHVLKFQDDAIEPLHLIQERGNKTTALPECRIEILLFTGFDRKNI